MALYWVGGDASTDCSNANNWAATSGGAGGAGTPAQDQDLYFDVKGSGNCVLTQDIECSGMYFDYSLSSYDLVDAGYNIDFYSNISADAAGQIISSTGTWTQRQSVTSGAYTIDSTSNRPKYFVLASGVSIALSHYLCVGNFKAEADTTLTAATSYLLLTYPTNDHFFDVHPTFNTTAGVRFYVSSSVSNSGINGNIGGLYFGYGGTAGGTYTTLGDIKLGATGTGQLRIHASSNAVTETQVRKVDMNGYNLDCGEVQLGSATTSYNGYGGMIKFGTGRHDLSTLEMSSTGENKNTYGYWDFGSGVININGSINLEVSSATYTHDGATTMRLSGNGPDYVKCSGVSLPTVHLSKANGVGIWLEGNLNCDDLKITSGGIDLNGAKIVMPQRVRPLTVGSNKVLIGKRWVN